MGLIVAAAILLLIGNHQLTYGSQEGSIFPLRDQANGFENYGNSEGDNVFASSEIAKFTNFGQLSAENINTKINELMSGNSLFSKTFDDIQDFSRKPQPDISLAQTIGADQKEIESNFPRNVDRVGPISSRASDGIRSSANVARNSQESLGSSSSLLDQPLDRETSFSNANLLTQNAKNLDTPNNSPAVTQIPLKPIDVNSKSTTENQPPLATTIVHTSPTTKANVDANKTSKFYLIRNNNQTSTRARKAKSKITRRKLSKVLSTTRNVQTLVKTTNIIKKQTNNKTANNIQTPTIIPQQRGTKFYLIREPFPKNTINKRSNARKPQKSRSTSTKVFKTYSTSKTKSILENILTQQHESITNSLNMPNTVERINNIKPKLDPNRRKFYLLREPDIKAKAKPARTSNIRTNLLPRSKLQNLSTKSNIPVANQNVNILPNPNINSSPIPNVNISPNPNVNSSPNSNGNISPNPNVNISPNPNVNISPNPSINISPDPNFNSSPDSNFNISPDQNSNISPNPNSNISPNPNINISPDPNLNISPDTNFNISPNPNINISPDSNFNISPNQNVNISPNPSFNISPNQKVNISPDSNNNISPNHNYNISPDAKNTDNTNSQLYPSTSTVESTFPLESEQNNKQLGYTNGRISSGASAMTRVDESHNTDITNSTTAQVEENTSKIITGSGGDNSSVKSFITRILKKGTSRKRTKKRIRKVTRRIVKSMKAVQSNGSADFDQTIENKLINQ